MKARPLLVVGALDGASAASLDVPDATTIELFAYEVDHRSNPEDVAVVQRESR
jgi:hypothetical protein